MRDPLDLDGRIFDLVSSTASRVDAASPTRFVYREVDGLVWGEYAGDTVTIGRFVGVRDGDRLHVSFVHRLVTSGTPIAGDAASRIEHAVGLPMRLVEEFTVGGLPQQSVCVEVRDRR